MPTYSFFCEAKHESSWWGAYKDRPAEIACESCSEMAVPGVSRPSPPDAEPGHDWMARLSEYQGLSLHDFECPSGHWFDEIVDPRTESPPGDGRPCPECGLAAGWRPSARIDRFSERFPYYDRGLGCIVNSRQHRLDVAKSKGVTPVEGDWDVEKVFSKQDAEEDALTAGYQEYCERLDTHPGFRDYRKARDQGRV